MTHQDVTPADMQCTVDIGDPNNIHFIPLERAKEYELHWDHFMKNFKRLLEWATNVSDFKNLDIKEIREICKELNDIVLISSERFELEPIFKEQLLKMIKCSDFLDATFGLKPIDENLHKLAKDLNSDVFEKKRSVACIILTGRGKDDGRKPDKLKPE